MPYTFGVNNGAGAETINNLIPLQKEQGDFLVNLRDLHKFLGVKSEFNNWVKRRIKKYGFMESRDYRSSKITNVEQDAKNTWSFEYQATLSMAKQLTMVENNSKGRQAREYFIAAEEKFREVFKEQKVLSIPEQMLLAAQVAVDHENRLVALEEQKRLEDEVFGKLPPPSVEIKDLDWQKKLNMRLRAYCREHQDAHGKVWNTFYYYLGYHLGKNFFEMKKKGIKPLSWLRENHQGEEAYALACKYFPVQKVIDQEEHE